MDAQFAGLIHDNEQDDAECRVWFNEMSEPELIGFWLYLVSRFDQPHDDAMECVLRLAQLKFAELTEQRWRGRDEGGY